MIVELISMLKKKGGKEHSYTKRVINSLNQMGIIFSLFFPKCLTGYIFLIWNNLETRIDRDALQNTLGVQTFSIFLLDSLGYRRSFPSWKTTYLFWIQGRKIEVKKSKGYPKKMKIMASGHITSWQIDLETIETVTDFIFLGFKITADGDCHHDICSLEEKL